MKLVLKIIGGLFALLFLAMMGIGIMIQSGYMPDTMTKAGTEIRGKARNEILKIVSLRPNETLEYFYSFGLTYRGDGNLITSERVISWWEEDDTLLQAEADFADIASLETAMSDSEWVDSEITINLHDGTWFLIWLSAETNADKEALAYLQSQIAATKQAAPDTGT